LHPTLHPWILGGTKLILILVVQALHLLLHHSHHVLHVLHLLHVLAATLSIHIQILHLLLQHHHLLHHLHLLLWIAWLPHLLSRLILSWHLLTHSLVLDCWHGSTGQWILSLSVPHVVIEWIIQSSRHIIGKHWFELWLLLLLLLGL
jgi:hypothetical protein